MSKQIQVKGKTYDSRTIVTEPELLKLVNHPRVSAMAIPNEREANILIIVKIPFGMTVMKEVRLISNSPRRIDAINKVVNELHNTIAYRRKSKAA